MLEGLETNPVQRFLPLVELFGVYRAPACALCARAGFWCVSQERGLWHVFASVLRGPSAATIGQPGGHSGGIPRLGRRVGCYRGECGLRFAARDYYLVYDSVFLCLLPFISLCLCFPSALTLLFVLVSLPRLELATVQQ